jgi:hypothetical protein
MTYVESEVFGVLALGGLAGVDVPELVVVSLFDSVLAGAVLSPLDELFSASTAFLRDSDG